MLHASLKQISWHAEKIGVRKALVVICNWKQPDGRGDCRYNCKTAGNCHPIKRLGV